MDRRKLIRSIVAGSIVSLAGCSGLQGGGDGGDGGDGSGETDSTASGSSGNTSTAATPNGDSDSTAGESSGTASTAATPSGDYEIAPGPESGTEYQQVRDITFWTMPRSSQSDLFQVGRLAVNDLAELGITINFEVQGQSQRVDQVFSGNFDMAQLKWSGLPTNAIPYYNLYSSFHSDNTDTTNIPKFSNDSYDQAVNRFKTSYDKEERVSAAQEAQTILAEQAVVDFCVVPQSRVAANTSTFTNWKAQIGGYSYSNVNTFRELEASGDSNTLIYGSEQPLRGFPNFMTLAASPETWILYKFNYDSLIELGFEGEPQGRAAEDWNVEDDTTITFTLREDLTWHDGESLTAEDVKFTWDYVTEWEIGWLSGDYAPYDSSEVVDERTIRFNLSEPSAIFIPISAYRMPILPKHVWEGVVEDNDIEEPSQLTDPDTTGSGPLQLDSYEANTEVVFEKFSDHYWADQMPFDRFIQNMYGSQTPAIGDLEEDNIHFMQSVLNTEFDRLENLDQITANAAPNFPVSAIFFLNTIEPYDDQALRRAFAYATNKEDMINIIYNGNATNSPTCVAPAAEPYYNPDIPMYEYDVTEGRRILQEAGYRWDDGGNLLKPVEEDNAGTPPI